MGADPGRRLRILAADGPHRGSTHVSSAFCASAYSSQSSLLYRTTRHMTLQRKTRQSRLLSSYASIQIFAASTRFDNALGCFDSAQEPEVYLISCQDQPVSQHELPFLVRQMGWRRRRLMPDVCQPVVPPRKKLLSLLLIKVKTGHVFGDSDDWIVANVAATSCPESGSRTYGQTDVTTRGTK